MSTEYGHQISSDGAIIIESDSDEEANAGGNNEGGERDTEGGKKIEGAGGAVVKEVKQETGASVPAVSAATTNETATGAAPAEAEHAAYCPEGQQRRLLRNGAASAPNAGVSSSSLQAMEGHSVSIQAPHSYYIHITHSVPAGGGKESDSGGGAVITDAECRACSLADDIMKATHRCAICGPMCEVRPPPPILRDLLNFCNLFGIIIIDFDLG